MKKINKSRYAILGMIFDKSRSGYEIRQRMIGSTGHFWQESDASIYPMLRILEAEGKVTSREEFVGKRAKKIFEITKAGKNEFLSWMGSSGEAEHARSELLLKLFFGATTSPEELIWHLETKLPLCIKKKTDLITLEKDILTNIPSTNPHKLFWLMTLKNGIIHYNAEIKWIKNSIQSLKEQNGN